MEGDDEVNVSSRGSRYTFGAKTTKKEYGVEVEETFIFSVDLFGNKDDDWADRLNYVVTMFFILACVAYTTFVQYITSTPPIDCWCPAEFTDTHVEYVQYHCWISNTYYVPSSEALSQDDVIRRRFVIKYYQWGPIILFLMALMFKLPNILWRLTNVYSGVNVGNIGRKAADSQEMTWKKRQETIENLASYLHRWLHLYHNHDKNWRRFFSKIRNLNCDNRSGNYLTALYMIIKCIYCINVIGQFFLLDVILGQNFYLTLGIDFFQRPPSEINQLGLLQFPRVTMCDFKIRQMSNVQDWTVQCVLPLNMFYEAIFFFLWYWYAFVAVVTFASLLLWMWRVFFPINKRVFIEKMLKIHPKNKGKNHEIDKKKLHEFVSDFLRQDGAFVLRMVQRNTSDVFATDLVQKLWEHFVNSKS
ncbi:innexin unc-9-like [Saccostrea cucullata]|uniref:innexin unc-9-like n=1 Tax=Saccostrea cuccullata TaxID=36930 RepID=UPI002ED17F1A